MKNGNGDSLKQAAILLLNMGEEQASKVLKHLEPAEVEKLISYMKKLDGIREFDVVGALNNFSDESETQPLPISDSSNFIRATVTNAVGPDKAATILDKASLVEHHKGLESLKWQTPQLISEILEEEHPQIIAIAMTYLNSEKAAQTLKLFPKELRLSILKRLTRVGPISPSALENLDAQFSQADHFRMMTIGGVDTTANIVNMLDSELENEVLTSFSEEDENLADEIQDRMFPFEKLTELEPRTLQTLLRDVANDDLVVALKGTDPEVREIFFKNISARAAEMLRDDLEAMGPVQLSKVIDTQKKIIALAKRLNDEGKIRLGNKNSNDMVE